MKPRIVFLILTLFTIVMGLLSRDFRVIPLYVGDILWATMVYFIVRFLFINATATQVIIIALGFCYAIEFSQLYKAPWIDSLRHTLFGHLVLGDTFLWGDLLSYTVGIILGVLVEIMLNKGKKSV